MESNIILGAIIAILSGVIVQILNSYLDIKKEKKRYILEKIDDIIDSISAIEESLQKDAATAFGVVYPVATNDIKVVSAELIKINCLIKVFHPVLEKNIDILIETIHKYFDAKLIYSNLSRSNSVTSVEREDKLSDIKKAFTQCTIEIKAFTKSLTEYARQ